MSMNVKKKLNNLTMDEKLRLLTGCDGFSALRLPEKELYGVQMADGPYGVKTKDGSGTCFLNTCLMASSWDREICLGIGKMLGAECKRFGVDVLLAPAVNIKRHPFCGRNFEYYSEDPVLTGILASEFINGIQSEGTSACVKHYACYSQEDMRWGLHCCVDDDTLRNIYLKAFELIIDNANPHMLMAAYSRVNGAPATENSYLLKDILRDEWHYNGVVVSDWCAVTNLEWAFKNGLDIEMPGNEIITFPVLQRAFEEGRLTETEIDEKLERLLGLEQRTHNKPTTDTQTDSELVRKWTGESFVLLQNDGVLPLGERERVLVVGKTAKNPKIQGGGCAEMKTQVVLIPFDEMQKKNALCEYVEEYELSEADLKKLHDYDKIVVFLSVPAESDSEAFDRIDFFFPQEQIDCLKNISRYNENIIAVMQNGSSMDMGFAKYTKGILETYYAGSYGGGALADVLFGKTTPSGRLAESFPVAIEQVPSNKYFGQKPTIVYEEKEFVGYRYYTTYGVKPAYPFGFGLSYAQFVVENVQVEEKSDYEFLVRLDVCNTSKYDGKETVQIYLQSENAFEPKMRLLDFCKVQLNAGERKRVEISLTSKQFQRYTGGKKRWLEGQYAICIARSCEDVLFKHSVVLEKKREQSIDRETPMGVFLLNANTRPIALKYFLTPIKIWAYGDGQDERDFEKDEFMRCSVYNMPVRSFLYFANQTFNETTIDVFLQEVKEILKK